MKNALKDRERKFCRLYALLRNPREAAIRAGWPPDRAEADALALLAREDVQAEIRDYPLDEALGDAAAAGYLRLAFGSQSDAVRLALMGDEELPDDLDRLDLFGVSEIKKAKGGGFEVKLANRLEALDRLAALAQKRGQEEDSFYQAIMAAAKEQHGQD